MVKLKSDNPMGKASGKRNILGQITHSSLWKNISTFETSRYSAYSVIIGVQSDDSKHQQNQFEGNITFHFYMCITENKSLGHFDFKGEKQF